MASMRLATVLAIGRRLEQGEHWWRAAKLYEKCIAESAQPSPDLFYRLGVCRAITNRADLAIPNFENAIDLGLENFEIFEALAEAYEKRNLHLQAIDSLEKALAIEPARRDLQLRLIEQYISAKNHKAAIALLENLHGSDPEDIDIADRLAKTLNKAELRWRELEVLEGCLQKKDSDANWHIRIAESAYYLRRFEKASEHFETAYVLSDSKNGKLLYQAGISATAADQPNKAADLYDRFLVGLRHEEKKLGIGQQHEKAGHWQLAVGAYQDHKASFGDEAKLLFRKGRVAEKLYDWEYAKECYEESISLDLTNVDSHYRLAYVCDRLEEYKLAAWGYTWAAEKGKNQRPFRLYRAGYSYAKSGEYKLACEAYIKSCTGYGLLPKSIYLVEDQQESADKHLSANSEYLMQILNNAFRTSRRLSAEQLEALADSCIEVGDLERADGLYRESIFHTSEPKTNLLAKRAYALYLNGDMQEACEVFQRIRLFGRVNGVDERPYLKGPQTRRHMIYNEFRETRPIEENIVLFESSHGSAIHCNPLAIYDEVINSDKFSDFKFVWVLNNAENAPEHVSKHKNTKLVKQHSDEYLEHLATAKYLINNATFPTYFIRRDKQKYLNTWHGTPLKLMGKKVANAHFEHSNVVRNFLHATHMFLPNEHTAESLTRDHDIDGLISSKIMIGGSPRVDATINASSARNADIRRTLGISDSKKKVVLYAPTWRGLLGQQTFDTEDLVKTLESIKASGHEVMFRAHRFAERAIASLDLGVKVVPASIDTNHLLSVVDVLITDYSSIFFDFLPTQKPIVFYTPDYDEYQANRGLYFECEDWPGQVCTDQASLASAVESALRLEQRPAGKFDAFATCEDGSASARAVDFFFGPVAEYSGYFVPQPDSKKNILFYQGSFIPNGITTSFNNLVASVDHNVYEIYVAVDANQIKVGTEAHDIMSSLPPHVKFIARAGGAVLSPEERFINDRFHRENGHSGPEQREIFNSSMKKEFLRVFGYSHFDYVIDFEGYSRFWGSIFANPADDNVQTAIYLHNDMKRERDSRFPRMQALFDLYSDYDRLVSVSRSVHEENMTQLIREFDLDAAKFVYADNLIDIKRPEQLAALSDSAVHDFFQDKNSDGLVYFTNMARLSPEKGQQKLIRAFAQIHESNPQTRLLILGDGPLRHHLEALAFNLGIEDVVAFTGQLSNPFGLIKNSDCFVFSSEYEGQGLAMIESLILGVPVISTDVVGSKSVVENGHGLLVRNSIEGLVSGMEMFLNGWTPEVIFDPDEYLENAIGHFLDRVVPDLSAL